MRRAFAAAYATKLQEELKEMALKTVLQLAEIIMFSTETRKGDKDG